MRNQKATDEAEPRPSLKVLHSCHGEGLSPEVETFIKLTNYATIIPEKGGHVIYKWGKTDQKKKIMEVRGDRTKAKGRRSQENDGRIILPESPNRKA